MPRWLAVGLALGGAALAFSPRPAEAIPVFAHRYGLSCQACHTEVPHLTAFGQTFMANGYRIKGLAPKPAFPVALRVELAYASGGGSDEESSGPLPKTIVDEVELLLGGAAGPRGSYWAEAYVVDGGEPGVPRDVWYAYRATPDAARIPVTLRAGQFTLPLPLDPETFRETTLHYAIWDQTAGDNPFNFFLPKIGGQIGVGDPGRGLAGTVSFLQGHDTQSGLPAYGVDTMFTLERDLGDWTLNAYRYAGSRLLHGLGYNATQAFNYRDRFWRNGFGVGWERRRTTVNAVYQIGNDTAADVYGDALQTSGGFLQVRQALGDRSFAVARWDATRGSSFGRAITAGLGTRLSRNTRLTLFQTAQRDEAGRLQHITSSSFLFAL
ncbi:MAG TPA: hypothetical protein VMA36_17780 [Candidatus Limnocylindria bacterium]|jgi:hypothetical protein|nr:hypothetical protein [Candidatus Limnocylindria bacterium]